MEILNRIERERKNMTVLFGIFAGDSIFMSDDHDDERIWKSWSQNPAIFAFSFWHFLRHNPILIVDGTATYMFYDVSMIRRELLDVDMFHFSS